MDLEHCSSARSRPSRDARRTRRCSPGLPCCGHLFERPREFSTPIARATTGAGASRREISDRLVAMPPRRRAVAPSVVVSANTKTRKMGLMVPFVAPECGRMSQQLGQKRKLRCCAFRECSINFSLLASTDCEPRSVSHTFGVLVNLIMELSPNVEHLCKIRSRTNRGLCLPWRFICATRRLGGSATHANDNRF